MVPRKAIRKVSTTTEIGKYLFLKTERGQFGGYGGKHKNERNHEKRDISFLALERKEDGSLKTPGATSV